MSNIVAGNRSFDVGFTDMGGYWNPVLFGGRENHSQKLRAGCHRDVDFVCRRRCGKSSVSDIHHSTKKTTSENHPVVLTGFDRLIIGFVS